MNNTIETKVCKQCGASFSITKIEHDLYKKISPTFAGKKYNIPFPSICDSCRQQRRLSFRNERKLYRDNCDLTGRSIISMYSPASPYKVYDQDAWRGDGRDAINFGLNYNPQEALFYQFEKLLLAVPRLSMVNMGSENSDYCNPGLNNKDCYLVFSARSCEGCLYGRWVDDSISCIDCLAVRDSQNCYACIQCRDCYGCINCINCNNCSDCINCRDLKNKQYCISNKQYTKDEFEKMKGQIRLSADLLSNHDSSLNNINNENCSGNFIVDSKACFNSYDVYGARSIYNCQLIKQGTEDCIDSTLTIKTSLQREVVSSTNQSMCIVAYSCWNSSNLLYCDSCYNSQYCFACIGLRDKKYCILNKQYTKEEYEILVPEIMDKMLLDGELGSFFPVNLSPFGYNETLAHEYFPLEKNEAIDLGFKWSDYELKLPKVDKVLNVEELPDIKNVEDKILNQAIVCEVSGRPFRMVAKELEFYRKNHIQLPTKHPDVRYQERMNYRK